MLGFLVPYTHLFVMWLIVGVLPMVSIIQRKFLKIQSILKFHDYKWIFGQLWILGLDCWVPAGSLDTHIDICYLCHISSVITSILLKWHKWHIWHYDSNNIWQIVHVWVSIELSGPQQSRPKLQSRSIINFSA
jgi:hypothetical protein